MNRIIIPARTQPRNRRKTHVTGTQIAILGLAIATLAAFLVDLIMTITP